VDAQEVEYRERHQHQMVSQVLVQRGSMEDESEMRGLDAERGDFVNQF
jgi:hypothetical protein